MARKRHCQTRHPYREGGKPKKRACRDLSAQLIKLCRALGGGGLSKDSGGSGEQPRLDCSDSILSGPSTLMVPPFAQGAACCSGSGHRSRPQTMMARAPRRQEGLTASKLLCLLNPRWRACHRRRPIASHGRRGRERLASDGSVDRVSPGTSERPCTRCLHGRSQTPFRSPAPAESTLPEISTPHASPSNAPCPRRTRDKRRHLQAWSRADRLWREWRAWRHNCGMLARFRIPRTLLSSGPIFTFPLRSNSSAAWLATGAGHGWARRNQPTKRRLDGGRGAKRRAGGQRANHRRGPER